VKPQALLAFLRQSGVHSTRSTTFVQGRTVRWALAWSFFEVSMTAYPNWAL
jgi:hypothetical protein